MPRTPVSRGAAKVPMPGSLVGAMIFLGLLAAASLYVAFGTRLGAEFPVFKFTFAGFGALSAVLAVCIGLGQTWARMAGMILMCILVVLYFLSGAFWFAFLPLAVFACLYGQASTDWFRFKATGELPRRRRR